MEYDTDKAMNFPSAYFAFKLVKLFDMSQENLRL